MTVKLLAEQNLEFLSLKGGYIGSSEPTPVKMPQCWKSHVMAHMLLQLLKQHLTCVVNFFYQCSKNMKTYSNFSDQKATKPFSKIFY